MPLDSPFSLTATLAGEVDFMAPYPALSSRTAKGLVLLHPGRYDDFVPCAALGERNFRGRVIYQGELQANIPNREAGWV